MTVHPIKKAKDVFIDKERNCYQYMHYGQKKLVSFQYAYDKAFKVINELNTMGLALPVPLQVNIGTMKGWENYLTATYELENYCKCWRVELECLLTKELIGFEGCKVKATFVGGNESMFYVERFGRYAPYHIMRRKPGLKAGGKRVVGKISVIQLLEDNRDKNSI